MSRYRKGTEPVIRITALGRRRLRALMPFAVAWVALRLGWAWARDSYRQSWFFWVFGAGALIEGLAYCFDRNQAPWWHTAEDMFFTVLACVVAVVMTRPRHDR